MSPEINPLTLGIRHFFYLFLGWDDGYSLPGMIEIVEGCSNECQGSINLRCLTWSCLNQELLSFIWGHRLLKWRRLTFHPNFPRNHKTQRAQEKVHMLGYCSLGHRLHDVFFVFSVGGSFMLVALALGLLFPLGLPWFQEQALKPKGSWTIIVLQQKTSFFVSSLRQ